MLLVDTNVFLAAADRSSDRHEDCAGLLRTRRAELATTVPVLAEAAWLILDRLGPRAQERLVGMVVSGRLSLIELGADDWRRCWELVGTYSDLRLDLVDASIVAVAERLSVSTIATLDRRDFTVVRPRNITAFELLP